MAPPGGPDDRSAARANPVILNRSSLLSLFLMDMVVEAGLVVLLLAFRGAAALPVFVADLVIGAGSSRCWSAAGTHNAGAGAGLLEYCGKHDEDAVEWIHMKTKLTQRRFKAQKSSACGLCKPWKKGGEDKKTVSQLRKAKDADQQLKEV